MQNISISMDKKLVEKVQASASRNNMNVSKYIRFLLEQDFVVEEGKRSNEEIEKLLKRSFEKTKKIDEFSLKMLFETRLLARYIVTKLDDNSDENLGEIMKKAAELSKDFLNS